MVWERASASDMNYIENSAAQINPDINDHPRSYGLQTPCNTGFLLHQNAAAPHPARAHNVVKRDLRSYHIFFIVTSGTIGIGLFVNSSEILAIAGPGGSLLAYGVVGVGVICLMEGIVEMIGHWPISNAMIKFVKEFVDKDLAIVIGFAYWYAYSISFATLIIVGANLATHWSWSITGQDIIFFTVAVLSLLTINYARVQWYGWTETVGGALKLLLVPGAFITMCYINANDTEQQKIVSKCFNDEFQKNQAVASNPTIAVLVTIPMVTFAYIGVEIVTVTASEAHNPPKSLKYPAKYIAYITALIYFIFFAFFGLHVGWRDSLLPILEACTDHGSLDVQPCSNDASPLALVTIAAQNARSSVPPDILNSFLIFVILSTANTALYVSSRTLFGLTRDLNPESGYFWVRWLSKLGTTTPRTNIPGWALVVSAASFCWVPFLRLNKGASEQALQDIINGVTTAVVLVWASQCLAFIRYRRWLKRFQNHLTDQYRQFDHESGSNEAMPFSSLIGWMQPFPAWLGLVSCILSVLMFSTAGWRNGGENTIDLHATYIGPIVLFVFWLLLKAFRFRQNGFYNKLGGWDDLRNTLDYLTACITDAGHGNSDAQNREFTPPNVVHFKEFVPPKESWSNLQRRLYDAVTGESRQALSTQSLKNQSIFRTAGQYFLGIIKPTQLPPGFVRIKWICRCGHSAYDEYQELVDGGASKLVDDLVKGNAVIRASATNQAESGMNEWFRSVKNLAWKIVKGVKRSPPSTLLPTLQGTATSALRSSGSNLKEPDPRFLLFCIGSQSPGRLPTLDNLNWCYPRSDCQLFTQLRNGYSERSTKGSKSKYRIKDIHFVEFEVRQNHYIDGIKFARVPPAERITEYEWEMTDVMPPVGSNYMMHLLHCPLEGNESDVCVQRFPKKMQRPLIYSRGAENRGWGVYIEQEATLSKFPAWASLAGALGSLAFGIYWNITRQDIQGAWGVANYITSFISLVLFAWHSWAVEARGRGVFGVGES